MRTVLIQQKVRKALDDSYPTTWNEDKKKEVDEIAFSTIILHLSDSILRKVDEAKSTAKLWKKLEALYMVKTLPNKIFLLEKFFGFKMDTSKDLDTNLDDRTAPTMGPALGKFHQNFHRNFGRTSHGN